VNYAFCLVCPWVGKGGVRKVRPKVLCAMTMRFKCQMLSDVTHVKLNIKHHPSFICICVNMQYTIYNNNMSKVPPSFICPYLTSPEQREEGAAK
jgi:hypothetical protein